MKRKSFELALSGIASAIAALFLTLGTLNSYLLMTGYLFGTFAVMLPLARQFPWGSAMTYVASSLLSLLFGSIGYFWRLLPFLVFFGLHPVFNYFQVKKRWNRVVCFIVKAVWFDVMLYLVWLFVFGMMTNFPVLDAYMPWIMFPVGILLFYPYDYMMFRCQMSVDALVSRIRRR